MYVGTTEDLRAYFEALPTERRDLNFRPFEEEGDKVVFTAITTDKREKRFQLERGAQYALYTREGGGQSMPCVSPYETFKRDRRLLPGN